MWEEGAYIPKLPDKKEVQNNNNGKTEKESVAEAKESVSFRDDKNERASSKKGGKQGGFFQSFIQMFDHENELQFMNSAQIEK